MRKSRFSEEQIIGVLEEYEGGLPVAEICRRHRRLLILLRREGLMLNHKDVQAVLRGAAHGSSSWRTLVAPMTSSSTRTASRPPAAIRCLHLNSRLGERPCVRATNDTDMPGCSVSSTSRIFSCHRPPPAALHRGDHLDALDLLRHSRTPRLMPRPSRYATCPLETGAASPPISSRELTAAGVAAACRQEASLLTGLSRPSATHHAGQASSAGRIVYIHALPYPISCSHCDTTKSPREIEKRLPLPPHTAK